MFVGILLALPVIAADTCEDANTLDQQVRAGMKKATQAMIALSSQGGYLYFYTLDLSRQAGEQMASKSQIWVQPPGTPAMGMAFLNAYEATQDPFYLEAASQAALALVKCQLPSGGWHYSGDFDPERPNRDGQRSYQGEQALGGKHPDNPHYFMASTFDDDNTQSAIRFLMRYSEVLDQAGASAEPQVQSSLDRSLQCLLKAQYPNGAWPQRYSGEIRNAADHPVQQASFPEDYPPQWPDLDYTAYYTLNDRCQRDCIFVMFEAYERYQKPEYLEAAIRGADFILLAQLPEPQAGWAQQYDFEMHPAWARKMEPPGVSSAETRASMEALLDIYQKTGDEKYLGAIDRAIVWLHQSEISPGRWARLYEVGTNRPIYGGDNGRIFYDVEKGRRGYNWQSAFGIPAFLNAYQDAASRQEMQPVSSAASVPSSDEVEKILTQMDEQGRWITTRHKSKFPQGTPLISTQAYIKNMNQLARYLSCKGEPLPSVTNE